MLQMVRLLNWSLGLYMVRGQAIRPIAVLAVYTKKYNCSQTNRSIISLKVRFTKGVMDLLSSETKLRSSLRKTGLLCSRPVSAIVIVMLMLTFFLFKFNEPPSINLNYLQEHQQQQQQKLLSPFDVMMYKYNLMDDWFAEPRETFSSCWLHHRYLYIYAKLIYG